MDSSELLTWSVLYTLGGASLVVFYVVQVTKHLIDKFMPQWFTTNMYSVNISFLVLLSATGVVNGLNWSNGLLSFFNAFVVAYISGKQFDEANKEGLK